jgi:hypothetical protein
MPKYIPILSIRPAEVVALAELPDLAKDRMRPLILIKPWLGSGPLARGLDKIHNGFPGRHWFAELDPEYESSVTSDSYAEVRRLRDPSNGFAHWIEFVRGLDGAIPTLQFRGVVSADQILEQIDNALELDRGVCVRIDKSVMLDMRPLIDVLADRPSFDLTVIIDYGQQDARLLVNAIAAIQDVRYIQNKLPTAKISLSSTTFPYSFGDSAKQEIYERSFANLVGSEVGDLIYSDRGSARAGDKGGGGVPRPRIDLPTTSHWYFFRSDCVREEDESAEDFRDRRILAYGEMADAVVASEAWDPTLNIWGTQLIKITQLRSEFGINSPAKSTACRINIHLAKQALSGIEVTSQSLEEEWVD